jgi:hypothetical protein
VIFLKNVDMSECLKKHPMLHLLSGVGIGLLLVAFMPSLASNALMLGIILFAAGVVGEFVMGQK